ncbi:M23 family metallopeptidase [Phytoactinopolyspora mesophila]|uniref:Peptidoglycan DD-metalloendopeptidase family protein n=1 Tax=Phytoactinopolyspora mesophila TaxID=2650750 RepID=A0A7K3MCH3_9ACTN|nr:M23 family metallopeptidase [Phytoactinopolyspora mesophila]NDL60966.1 peptidoglycan DD-metalloendopeptidase family protein [Phytoactinopolyspora mesophila]
MHPIVAKAALRLMMSRRNWRSVFFVVAIASVLPLLVIGVPIFVLIAIVAASSGPGNTAPPPGSECDFPEVMSVEIGDLSSEQLVNAKTIVDVGMKVDVPEYGWVIAVATALQESSLKNLEHGDRDSLGLFQQRPSSGWGAPSEILDPVFASEAFYGGATSPHWRAPADRAEPPGLQDIAGWEAMTVTQAAQAVQRSAFPDAYARWEPLARAIVVELTGLGGDQCGTGEAMTCPATEREVERGLTPDALRVLRCLVDRYPTIQEYHGVGNRPENPDSDHPTGRAVDAMIPDWDKDDGREFGWEVAEWLQSNSRALGVRYIIWDSHVWSIEDSGNQWRDYEHPSGATDPTSLHLDHIHVSVYGDSAGSDELGEVVLPIERGRYRLTARFGDCGELWQTCHTGLDFAAEMHTFVRAVAAAEVVSAADAGAYGFLVKLRHDDGTETWYAHLVDQSLGGGGLISVSPGQMVGAGQVIGEVGMTGNTTGPHLHFEVRPGGGAPVDPEGWLSARGVDP